MARGRMISKSLSTSEKFAALGGVAGSLAEFCQALYPLVVTHTDDFGRLQGDPFTVKHVCYPASPRPLTDFAAALTYLHGVELVVWYTVGGKQYIQVNQFDTHQQGLHKRTRSTFPRVPGSSGNDPEIQGQEKRREEKRTKGKYPPTPLAAQRGPRLTRKDLQEAKDIRARSFGGCPHTPRCTGEAAFDSCVRAIAADRKTRAS